MECAECAESDTAVIAVVAKGANDLCYCRPLNSH